MIVKLVYSEFNDILDVINNVVAVCKNVTFLTCLDEQCMSTRDLSGIQFYGLKEGDILVAVMGIKHIKAATLIHYAYVIANKQRNGYGEKLLNHIIALAETSLIIVKIWKGALWVVNFYVKHGFKKVDEEEKNELLRTYWNTPKKHVKTLTVLKFQKQNHKTILLQIDPIIPELEKIQIAAEIIKKGGLVAFPTETVYGLGVNALNSGAVLALFKAKNRPMDNPPILHISDINQVYQLAKEVPKNAELLMKQFWPGSLTLIFKRSNVVPPESVAGLDTVAIRMPDHNIALALIKQSNTPIAAPSANLSGKPSPTTAQHVYDDLNGKIDAILDGGPASIGVESTVLDLSVDPPQLLRPGGTPFEAIQAVIPSVELHPFVTSKQEIIVDKARSPGMMHKHYAPNAEILLIEGSIHGIVAKITSLSVQYRCEGKKVGVLATDETQKKYEGCIVKSMGSRSNLKVIASKLFKTLREFDESQVDIILAESVPIDGIGLAVMNRLRKASGYNIIKA
jgi:L-threonylcarbamoyladenylate synthase